MAGLPTLARVGRCVLASSLPVHFFATHVPSMPCCGTLQKLHVTLPLDQVLPYVQSPPSGDLLRYRNVLTCWLNFTADAVARPCC